jgi:hypothetical protein
MMQQKVLLTCLSIRQSASGTEYLSGWLGKAAVVAFRGEPDKYGNQTWDLYLSEPRPKQSDQTPERRFADAAADR